MSYTPPNLLLPPGPLLWSLSPEALGVPVAADAAATPVSGIVPTSGTALLYPVTLTQPITVQALFWMNGATAGHCDCGVYNATGGRLVSTGSRAQAPLNALQAVSVSPTPLGPGRYYVALATGTSSATSFRTAFANKAQAGVVGALIVFSGATGAVMPLPATLTMSLDDSRLNVPVCGLSTRTLVTS